MVSNLQIGEHFPAGAGDAVRSDLSLAFRISNVQVVTGGMEDVKSAYLVLTDAGGVTYLLLDRHNDDGEYAPQLYRAPEGLDITDARAILAAASAIGNDVDALDDAQLDLNGLVQPGTVDTTEIDDALWYALYNFRDSIRLDAID